MRVIVDAYGGDNAPLEIIKGAVAARDAYGVEIVLTGEACEWKLGEYARDAAALGFNKTLIVMGHIGSERDGMRLLTHRLQERHADLDIRYFECGEVYQYLS